MSLHFIRGQEGDCIRVVDASSADDAIVAFARSCGTTVDELRGTMFDEPSSDVGAGFGSQTGVAAELADGDMYLGDIDGGGQNAIFLAGRLIRIEDCDDHGPKTLQVLYARLRACGMRVTHLPFEYTVVDNVPRYRANVLTVELVERGPPFVLE